MTGIIIRRGNVMQSRNGELQQRHDGSFAWKTIASLLRSLPGLRGAWIANSFDENGDLYDLSGQGRTLSYNGNPLYHQGGLVPRIQFDGTGDYLSRADEAGLDILGTEAYVAPAIRGLTCGGWFRFDRLTNNEKLISKMGALAADQAYQLEFRGDVANDPVRFQVGDGAAVDTVALNSVVDTTSKWYFCAGRFDPSTEIKVWAGSTTLESNTNVAGIPAALANSGSSLAVGGSPAGTSLLDGAMSCCFLCAAYISDAQVAAIWHHTRALYGH